MSNPTSVSSTAPLSVEPQYLQNLITQGEMATIYLASGIRLQGYITAYDKYTLLLKSNIENGSTIQLIYKHAISTVLTNPNTAKDKR